MKTVAIVGLGLMGASIAKALKVSGKYTVIGCDRNEKTCEAAVKDGVISSVWDGKTQLECDITLLCIGPSAAEHFIQSSASLLKKGSILSDICGVKRSIVSLAERVCAPLGILFVGGHPMAGRERSGYESSKENLFINRSYILTKTPNTDQAALSVMSDFAYDIGCSQVTLTTPEEHDRMIAFTSQLPHVLAGAYIKSPRSDRHNGYSAGSYHDVSRVASVDENLWAELFIANGDNLVTEIDLLMEHLREYKTAIENNDRDAVSDAVRRGRILKERDF